jgi:hypothetical protein
MAGHQLRRDEFVGFEFARQHDLPPAAQPGPVHPGDGQFGRKDFGHYHHPHPMAAAGGLIALSFKNTVTSNPTVST